MTLIIDCPSCQRKLRVPNDLLGLKVKCPSCATTFTAGETPSAAPPPPPPPPPEPMPSGALGGEPAPLGSADAPEPAPSPPTAPSSSPPAWSSDEPSPAAGAAEPTSPPSSPSPQPRPDDRPCPSCRQSIPVEATRCRFCGEPVSREEEDDRPWERPYRNLRRDAEPHRGTLVLVFGILSIVLGMSYIVSLVALPMGIAAWVMGQRDLARMRRNEMDPQGEGSTQAGWICGIIGTVISGFLSMCCVAQILWFAFVMAAASTSARNTNRPTTRPPNRFEAPAEILPLHVPVLPRIDAPI
jgi:predicted Zn finger-like uncharacterized protein